MICVGVRFMDLGMRLQKVQMLSARDGRLLVIGRGGWVAGGWECCITDEIGAGGQLLYICLGLTHVAFDFQCEVQKSSVMAQLLRDACVF